MPVCQARISGIGGGYRLSGQFQQMIVQDCEPGDGDRQDFRKFLEPMLEPEYPVGTPSPRKKARRAQPVTQ